MKKPPLRGVNVDEAVAAGAAIYAGLKSKKDLNQAQKKAISEVKLQDVSNFYMGTLITEEDPALNREVTVNKIVIERDAPLPAKETTRLVTVSDNQEAINCTVTQSEGKENNREFVNLIHEGELKFPDKKPKGRPLDVTFEYDTSGKIHCTFQDVETKVKYQVSVRPESAEDLKKQFAAVEHIVIE